jgi:hypothetical protein
MIDRKHIGHVFPAFRSTIEAGRIKLFCKAIGETAGIHHDASIARSSGYRAAIRISAPFALAIKSRPSYALPISTTRRAVNWNSSPLR